MIPVALTIAGSDNSAGAGIQADLKTFSTFGVYGTTALTCVVSENPRRVAGLQPVRPQMVESQILTCREFFNLRAAKCGMLYSAPVIRAVLRALAGTRLPLVVDPVMIATSGARLLRPEAVRVLTRELFPRAALVTPNLDEASALLGQKIGSASEAREAARTLSARFGVAFLVKGGHLRGREASDFLWDGRTMHVFAARFIPGVETHGTGCTYSAAICAGLARGSRLVEAVGAAKKFITGALRHSHRWPGGRGALNHFRRGP
ncbi:MAG: bifunctional hydroxymethylpyrimidine kinase/phosphomethylpyrimidine kinase [Verrucomicrobiae bacterium]|nr:bifunctional hydroxymethylpyrimidine kinase/phosphomethylpyrimidine kinase [Verrucomicrobiae bacterium]